MKKIFLEKRRAFWEKIYRDSAERRTERFFFKFLSMVFYVVLGRFLSPLRVELDYVVFMITERCTLRCRFCSSLIPWYRKPENFELSRIKKDMDDFFRVVHHVKKMNISGGEPLLHPDLPAILSHVRKSGKVDEILMITNATLLPSAEVLAALKENRVQVEISWYGENNYKFDEVLKLLVENNIPVNISSYEWLYHNFACQKCKSLTDLKNSYASCGITQCRTFVDGCLYFCPIAANGYRTGMFGVSENDYFNFRDIADGDLAKEQKKLEKRLRETEFLHACNYCDGLNFSSPKLPRAEQLSPSYDASDPWNYIVLPEVKKDA